MFNICEWELRSTLWYNFGNWTHTVAKRTLMTFSKDLQHCCYHLLLSFYLVCTAFLTLRYNSLILRKQLANIIHWLFLWRILLICSWLYFINLFATGSTIICDWIFENVTYSNMHVVPKKNLQEFLVILKHSLTFRWLNAAFGHYSTQNRGIIRKSQKQIALNIM